MPPPGEMELRESSSPVPAHTMSGLLGAIARSPIDTTRSLSNTGRYVVPWFVVFQMPLVAPTTKKVPVPGTPSMSVTRPAMFAGPMDRHSISAMKSSSSRATACWPAARTGRRATARKNSAKTASERVIRAKVRGTARFSMVRIS